jgi:hypothetical protein
MSKDLEEGNSLVRSEAPLMGKMMDILNPLVVTLAGASINRDTVSSIQKA